MTQCDLLVLLLCLHFCISCQGKLFVYQRITTGYNQILGMTKIRNFDSSFTKKCNHDITSFFWGVR